MQKKKRVTADHPIAVGSRVKIYNTTLGGAVFLEGIATVIRRVDDVSDQYVVKFDGDDPILYERFAQANEVV